MPEPSWCRRAIASVAGCVLLLGCASAPPPSEDLAPILPDSEAELLTAPPAARDALDEGLRWIVRDAPGTTDAASVSEAPPTAGERPAKPIAEGPGALSSEPPPTPLTVAPPAAASNRRGEPSHVSVAALDLRHGPALQSAILATVPEGSEVIAQDRSDEWVLVETAFGEGWVRQEWLKERLEPEEPGPSQDAPGPAAPTSTKGAEQ